MSSLPTKKKFYWFVGQQKEMWYEVKITLEYVNEKQKKTCLKSQCNSWKIYMLVNHPNYSMDLYKPPMYLKIFRISSERDEIELTNLNINDIQKKCFD